MSMCVLPSHILPLEMTVATTLYLTIVNIASKCRYQSLQSWFVGGEKTQKNEQMKEIKTEGGKEHVLFWNVL